MALAVKIPRDSIGRPLTEERLKAGLKRINKDIFFDYATTHGKEHPYQDIRQGVYFDGWPDGAKHVCCMDRGVLGGAVPEVPVWKTDHDIVEATWDEVSAQELLAQEPPFPMPCLHDENKVQIQRQVRNELLLSGWRHTFTRLMMKRVPGFTRSALEAEFGLTLHDYVEECLVPEEGKPPWEDDPNQPEEGKIWEEMGMYEARPTVCLDGEKKNDDDATVIHSSDATE